MDLVVPLIAPFSAYLLQCTSILGPNCLTIDVIEIASMPHIRMSLNLDSAFSAAPPDTPFELGFRSRPMILLLYPGYTAGAFQPCQSLYSNNWSSHSGSN